MDNPEFFALLTTVLVIAFIVGTFVAVFGVIFFLRHRQKKKIEALMAVGKQGEATILRLDDTGVLINNNPRVRLLLSVRIPGYAEYEIQKTMTIPLVRLPQVQPGSVVAVMADPMQQQNPDMVGLLLK